jgi:predicted transcriptional regulator
LGRARPGAKISQTKRREHPLERALRWQKSLQASEGITARTLAKRMKVSEATMSMTLRLLDLDQGIQEQILSMIGQPTAYHLGLRRLAVIAATPPSEQRRALCTLLQRCKDDKSASAEIPKKL